MNGWLNRFPQENIDGSPWLLYWKGMSQVFQHPDETQGLFERAFTLFTSQGDQLGEILACSGVMKSIGIKMDDFSSLGPWTTWLDSRMKGDLSFLSPELEAAIAADMAFSMIWFYSYRHAEIKDWLERALGLAQKVGDINQQLIILAGAVEYYSVLDDQENLAFFSKQAEKLPLSPALSPLSVMLWKAGEVFMKYALKTDHEEVLRLISEALETGRRSGIHIYDRFILQFAVDVSFQTGDLTRTAELLCQLERVTKAGVSRAMAIYQFLSGWYYFLKGDISRAVRTVKNMSERYQGWGIYLQMRVAWVQAQILYANGERDEAFSKLFFFKEIAAKFENRFYFTAMSSLCEAQFLLGGGEDEKGMKSLAQAMANAKEQEYEPTPSVMQPSVLASLCAKALEHGIEVEYAQRLIRNLGLFPDTPPLDVEKWPWAIKIYTLGRFELQRDGKPVEFSRKVRKKPLDVLKALLALGGKEAREEMITDMVWPEAEGDAAHHSFEVTLQRLRALLGYPQALQFRNSRLTLDERYCWVDFWAFDHLLGRVKSEGMPDRAAHAAQKAMDMYEGHCLAGETDEPWILPLRERLRSRFLGNVKWLGHHHEQTGRWQEALECYQKGLEIDDLAEELYRRLMTCHHRLGQKGEALSLYHRCKRTLSLVLGVSPSPETERLYQTIKGSP